MKKILVILTLLIIIPMDRIFAQQAPNNPLNAGTAPSVGTFSCPIPNGRISTHSHQVGTTLPVGGGHCTPGFYSLGCNCGTTGRRSKAIDVSTNGGDVYLPQINGGNVNWNLLLGYNVEARDGGGVGYTFQTTVGSDTWYIDFLHMAGSSTLQVGSSYPSGTSIGKVVGGHVHFTIGKNLKETPRANSPTDCDPNWLPSDFACDPSLSPVTPGSSTGGTRRNGKSNMLCVAVGTPTTPKPDVCNQAASNFTAVRGAGLFVHYCQNNTPAWPTGNGCNMAASGCGPTSLAMVMSTANAICNGGTCDPAAVNKLMEDSRPTQRDASCNSVVNGGALASAWFREAGMETAPAVGGMGVNGFDFEAAKRAIDSGYLIIGSAENAPSCGGGFGCNHIFVIQDVDPSRRTIHVRDPICGGGNQEVDYDDRYNNFIAQNKLRWLYAVPVRGIKQAQGVN